MNHEQWMKEAERLILAFAAQVIRRDGDDTLTALLAHLALRPGVSLSDEQIEHVYRRVANGKVGTLGIEFARAVLAAAAPQIAAPVQKPWPWPEDAPASQQAVYPTAADQSLLREAKEALETASELIGWIDTYSHNPPAVRYAREHEQAIAAVLDKLRKALTPEGTK